MTGRGPSRRSPRLGEDADGSGADARTPPRDAVERGPPRPRPRTALTTHSRHSGRSPALDRMRRCDSATSGRSPCRGAYRRSA
ncbi:2-C-methyl-D-erythritol 4-phosphate cytidylyltransferase [Actinomyces sp. oral taxon 448 str. F0400]|nr:2-C-methyl-D-erythritol 4-phosphate cytidylyltransferase [Actinomyces sp. oral taxon 448 str. F0400]